MSDRQEYMRFKKMPNGNIRCYMSNKRDKGGVDEWMITNTKNPASTVITAHEQKIFLIYETD